MADKRKRYALFPGWHKGKKDKDFQFITAKQLARKYGVKLSDCEIFYADDQRSRTSDADGLVRLYPRHDGKYKKQR